MKEKVQEIAIVPSTEPTAELIPQPTAELIQKSFAENTTAESQAGSETF